MNFLLHNNHDRTQVSIDLKSQNVYTKFLKTIEWITTSLYLTYSLHHPTLIIDHIEII